jgi:hypothetical protein
MQIKKLLRFTSFILLIFLLFDYIYADNGTFRVFFKDKGTKSFNMGSELYNQTIESLSPRAIERRKKVRTENDLISIQDAPIKVEYLQELENKGCLILAKIKWENYCVIFLKDTNKVDEIKSLNFVKSVQKTESKYKTLTDDLGKLSNITNKNSTTSLLKLIQIEDTIDLEMVSNRKYLSILNVPKVHNLGITGDSILIGFLDSGFRPKFINCLKNINLLAERDFIYRDGITSNQQYDHPNQDHHGSMCLSLAVANQEGVFVGGSPSASVALAKTENIYYERKIEEDWFFEGVEWLESLGVDIISASLGYYKFDSTEVQYNYDDLNGKTPIGSKAVNYAAERGVLFVVAAGNNGPNEKTLNSPADADSVFSVAAVDSANIIAKFSSRGTDGIERLRPHISAPGVNIEVPNPADTASFAKSSGTSLAAPLITASSALIMSAFPEIKASEVKSIIMKSADNYDSPNIEKGYGLPDIYSAIINRDIVISEMMSYPTHIFQRVIFKITYKNPIYEASITVRESLKTGSTKFPLKYIGENYFYADIHKSYFTKDTLLASVNAISNDSKERRKPYDVNKFIYLIKNVEKMPRGITDYDFPVEYVEEAKSFVYPSEAERSLGFVKLVTFSQFGSPVRIIVCDLLGKTVYFEDIPIELGIIERNIPVSELGKGMYLVQIRTKNRIESIKFIIL